MAIEELKGSERTDILMMAARSRQRLSIANLSGSGLVATATTFTAHGFATVTTW
jgi:hypothetical protein